jgi:hypothetical protein
MLNKGRVPGERGIEQLGPNPSDVNRGRGSCGLPGPPGPARPQKRTPKNQARLPSSTRGLQNTRSNHGVFMCAVPVCTNFPVFGHPVSDSSNLQIVLVCVGGHGRLSRSGVQAYT